MSDVQMGLNISAGNKRVLPCLPTEKTLPEQKVDSKPAIQPEKNAVTGHFIRTQTIFADIICIFDRVFRLPLD